MPDRDTESRAGRETPATSLLETAPDASPPSDASGGLSGDDLTEVVDLLAEGIAIILDGREALADGITIFSTGGLSDDPADAPTRDAIDLMDQWLDRALAVVGRHGADRLDSEASLVLAASNGDEA